MSQIDRLFRRPRPPKAASLRDSSVAQQNASIRETEPGARHVADLLTLPTDPETKHRYALVVVDAATGATDAEPMKTKSAAATLQAFKRIHARNSRKGGMLAKALGTWPDTGSQYPGQLDVDAGAEFRGAVKAAAEAEGVQVRAGQPGRHQQQALAETRNRTIGEAIGKLQAARELITDRPQLEWVNDLPKIIENINARLMRTQEELDKREKARDATDPEDRFPVATSPLDYDILPTGTEVHVLLPKDRPEDVLGKRQPGVRRAGDPAFERQVRTVERIALLPGKPPMYRVSGRPNVYYRRWELQRADDKAPAPDGPSIVTPRMIREGAFVPAKLHGRVGGKWLVEWLGFPSRKNWTKVTPAALRASTEGQRLLKDGQQQAAS